MMGEATAGAAGHPCSLMALDVACRTNGGDFSVGRGIFLHDETRGLRPTDFPYSASPATW